MQIGYIGLGKMGLNMVERLIEKGYECVVANDRNEKARASAERVGAKSTTSSKDLISSLSAPRTIWLMVPQQVVDVVLGELLPLLDKGDTVIDGGNSFFKDTMERAKDLNLKGIRFLDAGVSGGPEGARNGACIMVGGEKELFNEYEPLFRDLSAPEAYGYMGSSGAGHFVKMVHNGIEYGMMQSIAEGFNLMHEQKLFSLDLLEVARVYDHQSVITSRLINWLYEGYKREGEDLENITGTVKHTGEGSWTVTFAKEMKASVPAIETALEFRNKSEGNPTYTGKVLSLLRNMFGGHKADAS